MKDLKKAVKEYELLLVYKEYGLPLPETLSRKQLAADLINTSKISTEVAKKILSSLDKSDLLKELNNFSELVKEHRQVTKDYLSKDEEVKKLTEINTVLNKSLEAKKSSNLILEKDKAELTEEKLKLTEVNKQLQIELDRNEEYNIPFIKFIETVKRYLLYIQEQFNIESKSDKKLHERFTKPFIFTVLLFTIEGIVIHSHFWGSSLLALIILAILNILAYADQSSVLPFIRYEGLKRLRDMKAKAKAKNESFNPSFEVINELYYSKLKNTYHVVRWLAFITFAISFTQFLFNGYHYDNVTDAIKLVETSTLQDLINKFSYVYTWKNILIAAFMGFLAHYTIKVSVRIELPKIFKEILEKLDNE